MLLIKNAHIKPIIGNTPFVDSIVVLIALLFMLPGIAYGKVVGTFTNETEVAAGNYILYNNQLRPSDGTAKVNANRAYLKLDAVTGGQPTQMPGRRYIGMDVQGENEATGFENITAPEGQAMKVIENGQLIIIRGNEKFNAQGVRL